MKYKIKYSHISSIPGTALNPLHILTHFNLFHKTKYQGPPFVGKETEARKSQSTRPHPCVPNGEPAFSGDIWIQSPCCEVLPCTCLPLFLPLKIRAVYKSKFHYGADVKVCAMFLWFCGFHVPKQHRGQGQYQTLKDRSLYLAHSFCQSKTPTARRLSPVPHFQPHLKKCLRTPQVQKGHGHANMLISNHSALRPPDLRIHYKLTWAPVCVFVRVLFCFFIN